MSSYTNHMKIQQVTVVGSGIIGLTSAIMLQKSGFHVKLIAKERYDATLSSKVGAVWFPYEIQPANKVLYWSKWTYQKYESELQNGHGVSFINFFSAFNDNSNNDWVHQIPSGKVRKAHSDELPPGIDAAFVAEVPLVEPRLYLPSLFQQFIIQGGTFEIRDINSLKTLSLLDQWVVNCTGLGAKALCNDTDLRPMRGQILRTARLKTPSYGDATEKGALSYVINRSQDTIIGGTDDVDNWNLEPEPSDSELIINRFQEKSGTKSTPKILETLVGLRPMRSAVRFDFDQTFPNIFHNYGHGGAGFTVAWGCAKELSEILSASIS